MYLLGGLYNLCGFIYLFPLNRKGAAWRNANSRSGARNEKDKPQTSCVWKQGSYQTPRVLQKNIRADLKGLGSNWLKMGFKHQNE